MISYAQIYVGVHYPLDVAGGTILGYCNWIGHECIFQATIWNPFFKVKIRHVFIIILFCLIFLNGLFVMAEIALVSARKSKLEDMASKGDIKAKAALTLTENPELFLSTAQIGITLIAILTGLLFR